MDISDTFCFSVRGGSKVGGVQGRWGGGLSSKLEVGGLSEEELGGSRGGWG